MQSDLSNEDKCMILSFRQPQTNSSFNKKKLSRNCHMRSVKVWRKHFLIVENADSSLKIAKSFTKIPEK